MLMHATLSYHIINIMFLPFKIVFKYSNLPPLTLSLNLEPTVLTTVPHLPTPTDSQVGIINSALESKQLRIRCLVSCSCVQAVTFTTLSQHTQGCTGHRNLSSLLSSLDSQSSHRFGQPPPPLHPTPLSLTPLLLPSLSSDKVE